ncbi:cysteine--tRNA ligase [Rhodopseudomonas sp.]|uniref:cysteine--tRNA ligase n=1 Tax=Rhodopseudomonas sp. TaxID=1078 RepID=UPI003B3B1B4A
MALRLYDTLTKQKRDFAPLDPSNVRMYVCGPTVYDFAHIGNARPVIVFDVLFRLLRHLYGESHVKYVRNITDVDDKINDRAARDYPGLPLNEAIRKVTEKTEQQFHDDVDALGCLRPTVEPRATEHIAEMRQIIEKLVAGGFAYAEQDHVLFSPAAMNAANGVLPRYGALANRTLDEMIAGARVDVAPYKRDATDFVLWKPSKPGEPSWPSPAGITTEGRPGWHIECSAMSWKHLGETFDIHGGGIDLVFPHHENEVAQTCCAFHTERMAQTWMHNGFLQVEGEKMSKSLGNFLTISDQRDHWGPAVLRLNMLKTHYRQPIDWTQSGLTETVRELGRWFALLETDSSGDASQAQGVLQALTDDLNTSAAITELRALYKARNALGLEAALRLLGVPIGREYLDGRRAHHLAAESIETASPAFGTPTLGVGPQSSRIQKMIEARTEARARKDFKESDRIRDELAAMGIAIKDGKDADGKPVTTWEIAR